LKFPFRKVVFQTAISAFLGFSTLAIGFARVYFFSRMLTIEEFGMLSLLLTFSAFLMYIFTMGSYQYLFKRVGSGKDERRAAFWSSIFVTVVICALMMAGTMMFLRPISTWLRLDGFGLAFELMISGTALTAIMIILTYYHYGQGKNNFQNLLQFLRASLWVVVAIIVSMFLDLNLVDILTVLNISMGVIILIAFPWKEVKFLFPAALTSSELSNLFRYSFPLLPYFAGTWGIPLIIRSQLNIYEGAKEVALFSVAYTLMEIVFLFISNIVSTISPYFFSTSPDVAKPSVFYNVMLKYAALATLLILPFIFVVRYEVITIVASDKYYVAGDYIPLLLIFPLLRILILVFEQYYLKSSQTLHLGILYTAGIFICVVLCFWLIPQYSIYGAVSASLASYTVILVFLYFKQRSMVDYQYLHLPALILLTIILWGCVLVMELIEIPPFLKILPLCVCAVGSLFLLPILDDREKRTITGFLKIKQPKSSSNDLPE
jgi:O-antigen/teichoic acid export membrane protein